MNRDILTVIQDSVHTFSKGQRKIANFILESYDKAAFMTASRLGQRVGVSESTVVRFAFELGYDGYPDMQRSLQKMIRNRLTTVQRIEVTNDRLGDQDLLSMVLQSDVEKIRQTLEELDRDSFYRAVDAIVAARKIYIIGVRSSAAIASFLHFYFNLIFDNVVLVSANTASETFESLLRVGEGDAVIGISFPGTPAARFRPSASPGTGGPPPLPSPTARPPPGPHLPLHPHGPQRYGLLCGLLGGPAVPGECPAGGGKPAEK